jgi:signal transduction histidine kinase
MPRRKRQSTFDVARSLGRVGERRPPIARWTLGAHYRKPHERRWYDPLLQRFYRYQVARRTLQNCEAAGRSGERREIAVPRQHEPRIAHTNPRYLEYSGDILKSGRHLLAVINSVLDLAKSESGTVELCKRPVDLRQLLRNLAPPFKAQCLASGLQFVELDSGAPILVEADEARLGQVFCNLLSNAIRFTERGGSVSIELHEEPGSAEVAIGDTGIGMLPDDIETALTPFAQVDGRLARRYEGAGLGLPIAKALAELHDGTLGISSEHGCGTTVTVRLPRLVAVSSGGHAAVA